MAASATASSSSSSLVAQSQFSGCFESQPVIAAVTSRRGSSFRKLFILRALQKQQQQQQQDESSSNSRRSMIGLLAAASIGLGIGVARAEPTSIKITGPPPLSGGLPGTENADQARDLDLPLKERFFIQPLGPAEAAERVKDAAKDIVGVKDLIAKSEWPYVRNDLRNKASYLRYDLQTIISAKPKDQRKELKLLEKQLLKELDKLDYAAKTKNSSAAEKSYSDAIAALDNVIAKLA